MNEAISSQELPELKYKKFNHEWDELPIRANGAALALYITVITTLISSKLLHPNEGLIVPCAIYFVGLLLAFATHAIHFSLDTQMDQKERISDGFAWITAVQKLHGLPDEMKAQTENLAIFLADEGDKLLDAPAILRRKIWSAWTYALSLLVFLAGSLLVSTYFWVYLSSYP